MRKLHLWAIALGAFGAVLWIASPWIPTLSVGLTLALSGSGATVMVVSIALLGLCSLRMSRQGDTPSLRAELRRWEKGKPWFYVVVIFLFVVGFLLIFFSATITRA